MQLQLTEVRLDDVFSADMPEFVGPLARHLGIAQHLFEPATLGITVAEALIEPLSGAVNAMRDDPARYCVHGMTQYAVFLEWLDRALAACREYPHACLVVR